MRRGRKRRRTGDLVDDRPVAGMEDDARCRQHCLVGFRLHQVLARCKDMRAQAFALARMADGFAKRIQIVLHVLRIGRSPLVHDHQIGDDAART